MSDPPASQAAATQQPPTYPSYEALRATQLRDAQLKSLYQSGLVEGPIPEVNYIYQLPGTCLNWYLSGPLTTAISIKQGDNAPEPYWNNDLGQWHHLATSSLTEPRISSITVRVDALEQWYYNWFEDHRCHSDPPDADTPIELAGSGNGVWQVKADWNLEVDDEWNKYDLFKCCGEMPPRDKNASLAVLPAKDGQGFVTLHDYLAAVHPWLMSLRGDIIGALTTAYDNPIEPDTLLKVRPFSAIHSLSVEHPYLWDNSPGDSHFIKDVIENSNTKTGSSSTTTDIHGKNKKASENATSGQTIPKFPWW
ncbi:hypothetical protein BP6252_07377 [Coleophoma cylindrospora]|uniref:Uncharacterized protein n=1 Tax=Coleophoma cylindrospora TaxID=1849047 RepID=A0A3D8RHL7_9HELO|nr:hypothetical protein BP6252_07377 [Coleophoma cylindrospora]